MRTRIVVPAAAATAAAALLAAGTLASGQPASPSGAAAQDTSKLQKRALFAVLTGKKEVDPVTGDRGAGDPDGRGSFTATADGTMLCFGITVKNISPPVAAHIHKGGKKVAGPIVVPLVHPTSGDPGASSGCAEVEPDLLEDILRHPKRYYTNVHTADFGGGAVRGQLFKKSN